jgi:hypothetical protein
LRTGDQGFKGFVHPGRFAHAKDALVGKDVSVEDLFVCGTRKPNIRAIPSLASACTDATAQAATGSHCHRESLSFGSSFQKDRILPVCRQSGTRSMHDHVPNQSDNEEGVGVAGTNHLPAR